MKTKQNPSRLYRYFLFHFILITLAVMLIYALMTNTSNALEIRKLLLVPLLILVFLMTNLFVLYLLKRIFILNRKYEKVEMEKIKFQYLEGDLKLYRQHRHDMKNHLTIMYELVKEKKYSDLETYTKQYMNKTSNKLVQIHTGSDEIDVLLYHKFDQAKSNHILMEYNCKTELILNNHTVIDMVSIFSNLLDNAIEANKFINSYNDRMINITIDEDQLDYLFIITNTFMPTEHPSSFLRDGFTTKSNAQNHGLGLGIIEKLVHRYNGNMHIDVFNDRFFQIKIELPKHLL